MSKKKNITLIVLAICLVAIFALLYIGFTNAWFIANRKAEGTLEFVDGIKIEYSNLYLDTQNPSSKNLKLAYTQNDELKPLELNGVTSNQVFNLANPTLKAKQGTVSYYVRVRLNINLYYKDSIGNEILIDDNSRESFLETTNVYTKNDEPFVVTNEKDLFINLPSLDVSKLVYFNGWYYLAEIQGEVLTFEDINLEECYYNGEETKVVSFLNTNLNGDVILALDDDVNYGEKMPFSKVVISLDIEAVEKSAVNIWKS